MGFSSQSGQLILRSQAVVGTLESDLATAGVAIRLKSGSMSPSRELLIPDPEIGGGRDVQNAYLGAVTWSGSFDFYCRVDALATLLKGALGVAAAPATTTGVTTHVFTPSDTTMPYFSIEEKIGSGLEVYNYTDCVINSLHVEADANGYMSGSVDIIGAKQVAGATPTAAPLWDTTPLIVGTNIFVTYNSIALPAKSFSLDVSNNFDDKDFRLGSFYIGDLTAKQREVTASFNIRHADSSMWRTAVYGASAAVAPGGQTVKAPLDIMASTYEDIVGGTPTTKNSVQLAIPDFILKPFSFKASGDDIIEGDVEGQAVRPLNATPIITATIKTAKATVS